MYPPTEQHLEKQNAWQLTSIQASAFGVVGMTVGRILAARFGIGCAVTSIIIGNIVLWLVARGVITLARPSSDRRPQHIVESLRSYLGNWGGRVAALLIVIAFVNWYAWQLDATTGVILKLLDLNEGDITRVRIAMTLSAPCILISLGGIAAIRWTCLIIFPLQLIFLAYSCVISGAPQFHLGSWWPSLTAIVATIAIALPGVVNYPTFFRHARSLRSSVAALVFILVFNSLIEISSIFGPLDTFRDQALFPVQGLALLFVSMTLLTVNLTNIYFASIGWETWAPRISGKIEYAIMGLLGTAVYIIVQDFAYIALISKLSAGMLSCIGSLVLSAYLIRLLSSHRPRAKYAERIHLMTAWAIGSVVVILATFGSVSWIGSDGMLLGVAASQIVFLMIFICEEANWAILKRW